MDQRLRRFQVGVVAVALFGLAATAVQAQWHYYYFKQKQPLTLDVDRVAMLRPAGFSTGEDARGLKPAARLGIDQTAVEAWPIKGWFLAGTDATMKTPAGVQNIVSQISTQQAGDFVSPVFVGDDGGPIIITPDILVGFKPNIDPARAEAILAESNAGRILDRDWANMKGAYRLRSTSRSGFEVLEAANRLAQRPEVKFAEPDVIFTGRGSLVPNDPGFPDCWGLHNTGQFGGIEDMDMDAPEAWDFTTGDPSIRVVIIDTGVQQNHPDINQMTPGIDTTSGGGDGGPVNACDDHGTAVAGCVSATINNNLGTVGVAPDCLSASARTFISTVPCDGTWSSVASWTVNTLAWAESIDARVTNNSNYYGFQSSSIAEKYEDTRNAGMVHFGSAGNFTSSQITYPASLPTVNAVAALNPDGTLTYFSNWGNGLAFSAPGITIYTTDRTGSNGYISGDYVFLQGTSFASPYSAGVAALVLSLDSSLTGVEVEQIMQDSSVDLGDPGYDTTYGYGFVNAHQALLATSPPIEPCELAKLTAADATAEDRFGICVSMSGDRAVVGAYLDDDAGDYSGSAYVFRLDDNSTPLDPTDDFWVEEDKLTASDAAPQDWFGYSVSISGDRAVVGAQGDDDAPPCAPCADSGSAYVFRRDDNGTPLDPSDDFWAQEGPRLTASDAGAYHAFGFSVSISGDRCVIGAHGDDHAGSYSGSAYLFRRNDNATPLDPTDDFWVEEDKLTASDAAPQDWLGYSVSMSGDRAVVGAFADDDAPACAPCPDSGSVYVFRRDDNGTPSDPSDDFWVEENKLTASDAGAYHAFGLSVSISGGRALVGAYTDDDAPACAPCPDSGSAYVFRRDDNGTPSDPSDDSWIQEDKLAASDAAADDEFGYSVSMSGDRAVVGARWDDDAGDASGSAYVFRRDDNGTPSDPSDDFWPEQGKLTASDAAVGDEFGQSVSISGDRAVVGALYEDDAPPCAPCTDSGAAYVFGVAGDCNRNGIDDVCDLRDGTSLDIDGNGEPDECHCSPSSAPQAEMIIDEDKNLVVNKKNRFLSFAVGDPQENQMIRVKFVDLAGDYGQFNGNDMWVGGPFQVSESPAHTAPGQPGYTDFWAAKLGCEKPIIATDWTTLTGDCHQGVCWHSENAGEACTDDSECVRAIIHVYGEFVIPGSKYEIRVLDSLCPQEEIESPAIAPPLELATSMWGDVCGSLVNGQWSAADGECLVPNDVMAVLSKVAVHSLAPSKTRADVIGPENPKNMQPDLEVTLTGDVIRVLSACAARPFPAAPPAEWPCP